MFTNGFVTTFNVKSFTLLNAKSFLQSVCYKRYGHSSAKNVDAIKTCSKYKFYFIGLY